MLLLLLFQFLLVSSGARENYSQDELMSIIRAEMKDQLETVEEKFKLKAANMQIELEDWKMKATSLESSLPTANDQAIKELTAVGVCARQNEWTSGFHTITYDYIISDYGGGAGLLDVTTGRFTCGTAGHYTITYSGYAYLLPGERIDVILYKNNAKLGYYAGWYSWVPSGSGSTRDQGSRTVVSLLCVSILPHPHHHN